MENHTQLQSLYNMVRSIYSKTSTALPYHGWSHIKFVLNKSKEFSAELGADIEIVQSSALVHDLNYFQDLDILNVDSKSLLSSAGFDLQEISWIESVVDEAHMSGRSNDISLEAKALSDADSLFKALPITPIFFALNFMKENHLSIQEVARKIVYFQGPLLAEDIYFYSMSAKRYLKWAETNFALWKNVLESLSDHDVVELMDTVNSNL